MPGFNESEFAEFMEGLESESEAFETAEATRRVKKPSAKSSFQGRQAPGAPMYVTQTQLQTSLARVDGKIKTVSDGVSTINARLTALSASAKKEAEERKKQADNQSKDLNQKLQLLSLLPVLIQAPTVQLVAGNNLLAGGGDLTSVSVPDTNNLDSLLPILLVSGLGTTSGGLGIGGDSSSGTDSSMLMLALVLAFANK